MPQMSKQVAFSATKLLKIFYSANFLSIFSIFSTRSVVARHPSRRDAPRCIHPVRHRHSLTIKQIHQTTSPQCGPMMLLQILLELTAGLYLFHSSANDLINESQLVMSKFAGQPHSCADCCASGGLGSDNRRHISAVGAANFVSKDANHNYLKIRGLKISQFRLFQVYLQREENQHSSPLIQKTNNNNNH